MIPLSKNKAVVKKNVETFQESYDRVMQETNDHKFAYFVARLQFDVSHRAAQRLRKDKRK